MILLQQQMVYVRKNKIRVITFRSTILWTFFYLVEMFEAEIKIMPLPELLDPQGKTVEHSLHNLEFNNVAKVRIGKLITLQVDCNSSEEAEEVVQQAIDRLLVNRIIESASFEIKKLE